MIVVKIHGLNGMCTTEGARQDLINRLVGKLCEASAEDPKDIIFSFSGDYVIDGEGQHSSFCVLHVSPKHSTKDLLLLTSFLKSECMLGNRIKVANLGPLPIQV